MIGSQECWFLLVQSTHLLPRSESPIPLVPPISPISNSGKVRRSPPGPFLRGIPFLCPPPFPSHFFSSFDNMFFSFRDNFVSPMLVSPYCCSHLTRYTTRSFLFLSQPPPPFSFAPVFFCRVLLSTPCRYRFFFPPHFCYSSPKG